MFFPELNMCASCHNNGYNTLVGRAELEPETKELCNQNLAYKLPLNFVVGKRIASIFTQNTVLGHVIATLAFYQRIASVVLSQSLSTGCRLL